MKRIIALLLLLGTILGLTACQSETNEPNAETTEKTETEAPATETTAEITAETTEKAEPEDTKEPEKNIEATPDYPTVNNPLTWDDINAIPVAIDSMTIEQKRQICVDFFRLQQTFRWTPSKQIDYILTKKKETSIETGKVYEGLPYRSGNKTGNIYILMDYYDSETGILNVSLPTADFAIEIANNCIIGAYWGWGRVVNTIDFYMTGTLTQKHGCIPVGPYTYDTTIDSWSEEYGTTAVCEANGEQTMYESYAALQPADGLCVHSPGGHVRMVSQTPVVVRKEDGTIDPAQSYVLYIDQGSSWSTIQLEDGTEVERQGDVDRKAYFYRLYKEGYLPFTFAEFQGTDPVEEATASLDYTESIATAEQLSAATITTNYGISNLFLELYDDQGELLYKMDFHRFVYHQYSMSIKDIIKPSELTDIIDADGVKAKVSARVSTGQIITAWEGTLLNS